MRPRLGNSPVLREVLYYDNISALVMGVNLGGYNIMNIAEKWRTQPMYSFGEAARLADVSITTVRNWFCGYTTRGDVDMPPLFHAGPAGGSMISYLQLIETVVAARFRMVDNVHYRDVCAAYRNAKKILRVDYPFAHIKMESLGGHIIARLEGEEVGESLQYLDSPPQWALPGLVLETIHQFQYEGDFAAKWFPLGKEYPIVIDPRIGSGIPTIEGRGISVSTIIKRRRAGLDIDFIAQDLELESDLVETALHYGDGIAA